MFYNLIVLIKTIQIKEEKLESERIVTQVMILPVMARVIREKFSHLDCDFSECGKYVRIGLSYPETLIFFEEVIFVCNPVDCKTKIRGRFNPEQKIKKKRKKKKNRNK